MYIPTLKVLKFELDMLRADNPTCFCRIDQPSAVHLLEDIEKIENENKKLKEKLEEINQLSNLDF